MPLPWSRKQGEELPEELKNMEAKDLVNAINKSKEFDTLKSQFETVSQKANEVDELRQKLSELEQRTPIHQESTKTETPAGPTSFFDDEDKAFNDRMAPFAVQTLRNQAMSAKFIAKNSLKGLDAEIWSKWEKEIDEVMASTELRYQAIPQTWSNALDVVAGRHRRDLQKMQDEKTEFFSETVSNSGHGGPGPVGPVDHLDAEQERIAKRLGVTPDEYLKNLKEMTIRG
jgi:uncharacterized phage infection (PIP) family protein YhgE